MSYYKDTKDLFGTSMAVGDPLHLHAAAADLSDLVVSIDHEGGVLSAAPGAGVAGMALAVCHEWVGRAFSSTLDEASKARFAACTARFGAVGAGLMLLELVHPLAQGDVRVQYRMLRDGARCLLLGRVIQAADLVGAGGGKLSRWLEALYNNDQQAIVFAKKNGSVISYNARFEHLAAQAGIWLTPGSDLGALFCEGARALHLLMEDALQPGGRPMRRIAIRVGPAAREVQMYIRSNGLPGDDDTVFGFQICESAPLPPDLAALPVLHSELDAARELLGCTGLKEIVARTTEIVEKTCIEAALTRHKGNRAACASTLGMSRQSFYVKLRKYNML